MLSRRLFTRFAVALLVLAILTGCGAAPTATPVPPTVAPATFPVTITDANGRVVTLKSMPERIVSLSPSLTEDLFAIGAGLQVVGVTSFCNYPPEATKREQIGGYSAKTISVEKIVALKPQLVVAEAGIHNEIITALEPLGITVVAIKSVTFEDVYANLTLLGRLTGHSDTAATVVADMQKRIKAVTDKTAKIAKDKKVTVFWEIWDEPLMTAGPKTFPGQIIEMAGGVNIFADVTKDWPQVSAEDIIARNPSVIIGPDTHGDKLTTEQLAKRPGWDRIAAVKSGRIYLINGDTSSRPGPRLVSALEDAAKAFYPDLFK